MCLFYGYNFTLDFNGKRTVENKINSSTMCWSIYILSFWSIVRFLDDGIGDCRESVTKHETLYFVVKFEKLSKLK